MNIPGVKPRLHLAVLDVNGDVEIQRVVFGIWRACSLAAWRVLQIETQDLVLARCGLFRRWRLLAEQRVRATKNVPPLRRVRWKRPDIEALLFAQL